MPSTDALYDPVSVTGLIAGGANLVCFTSGRGSALVANRCGDVGLSLHQGRREGRNVREP